MTIGYYVHHQGHGHLHRAQAFAAAWRSSGPEVVGLSTLPRPRAWDGPWVRLPRDDRGERPLDVTAGGTLHWAPLTDPGVFSRASVLSGWLHDERPAAVVVDVSVETALLVRLHGVPVVSFVLPGRRTDPAHLLGFRASSALVAAWPHHGLSARTGLVPGLPDDLRDRIRCLGAVSRFDGRPSAARGTIPRSAVLLQGSGGDALWQGSVAELERRAPGWSWTVLGGGAPWVSDPAPVLERAAVVVTTAGESSLADVAALRRPAVVVPTTRPFDEQHTTAAALAAGPWPVVVAHSTDDAFSTATLARAAALDGTAWRAWSDGTAAARLLDVVESVAGGVGGTDRRATA